MKTSKENKQEYNDQNYNCLYWRKMVSLYVSIHVSTPLPSLLSYQWWALWNGLTAEG